MDYKEWAQNKFKNDIYATETTGIVIEEVDINYAKCSLKIETKHINANNSVMGGAIFTLADFTFAIASNVENRLTVAITSQINFVGTAKGSSLIAEAKCEKSGRSTCCFIITVKDDLDNIVATVTTTGFRMNKNL